MFIIILRYFTIILCFFVNVVFVLKLLLLFAVEGMSGSSAKVFIELWTFMAQVNKTPLICRIIYAGWHFYKLIDLHSWNDLKMWHIIQICSASEGKERTQCLVSWAGMGAVPDRHGICIGCIGVDNCAKTKHLFKREKHPQFSMYAKNVTIYAFFLGRIKKVGNLYWCNTFDKFHVWCLIKNCYNFYRTQGQVWS